MSGVELERDVIVASDAPQRVPPGGVVTRCRDCGASVLLDADGVREVGRRPAAVVLCPTCAKGGPLATPLEALNALMEVVRRGPPDDIRTHVTFDPDVSKQVQETIRREEAMAHWRWVNDSGVPVLVRRVKDGEYWLVAAGEPFAAHAALAPLPIPGFPVEDPRT